MIRYVVPMTMEEARQAYLIGFLIVAGLVAAIALFHMVRAYVIECRKAHVPKLRIEPGMKFQNKYRHTVWVDRIDAEGGIHTSIHHPGMQFRKDWWTSETGFKEHLRDRGFYLVETRSNNK